MSINQPEVIDFDSLESAERRKLLAQDVLAALDSKRMLVRNGSSNNPHVSPYVKIGLRSLFKKNPDMDAREAFAKRCTVCAKGALFVAAIDRFDKVKLSEVYDGEPIEIDYNRWAPHCSAFDWMSTIFSRKDLATIETAFEGMTNCGNDTQWLLKEHSELSHLAVAFYHKFNSPRKRMQAIMQNIAENGAFKLSENEKA